LWSSACKVRAHCRLPSLVWDSATSLSAQVGRSPTSLWSALVVNHCGQQPAGSHAQIYLYRIIGLQPLSAPFCYRRNRFARNPMLPPARPMAEVGYEWMLGKVGVGRTLSVQVDISPVLELTVSAAAVASAAEAAVAVGESETVLPL
jgi:hypothetical protein